MLTAEQAQALIDQLPGERVTADYIQSRIEDVDYFVPDDGTMTLCIVRLDNGFQVVGQSACVDPANFRPDIGEQIAYSQAIGKCWELFGFLLAETRFRQTLSAAQGDDSHAQ